ncbi:MAG: hypothetical protein KatS3mg068_2469 [Candidatus Sericytochromatia bacterium]|nr:MAG: hypothetical protein KatS3mg068_1596 [Candidatus Sericytochromatia bacterium]GIW23462.1 MAG: hypothetical protein KatS3mg068_2469 [Candidatus Sericytochromatia bacterium]
MIEKLNKYISSIIALFTIFLTFLLFTILFFVEIKDTHKDIVIYILGALSTVLSQIFSFYFGSSKGSEDKNSLIKDLTNDR